jgi:hypothetical protein
LSDRRASRVPTRRARDEVGVSLSFATEQVVQLFGQKRKFGLGAERVFFQRLQIFLFKTFLEEIHLHRLVFSYLLWKLPRDAVRREVQVWRGYGGWTEPREAEVSKRP